MICTKCKKKIIIPNHAYLNLENYKQSGASVLVSSECCGVGINVTMHTTFTHQFYKGDKQEDDWGVEIKL